MKRYLLAGLALGLVIDLTVPSTYSLVDLLGLAGILVGCMVLGWRWGKSRERPHVIGEPLSHVKAREDAA